MRDNAFYVSNLLELAQASASDRRVLWRQAMAALSRASTDGGPSPLEGIHPDVLVRGVAAALADGLADDLDWLSPSAAGVALYTLAAALQVGTEQRELGRRVLARMLAGDAGTFTAIATSMAQSAGKGLGSAEHPRVASRSSASSRSPTGSSMGHSHSRSCRGASTSATGSSIPSTRSLPQRRLTAKILERAAREAARRAQMGDTHALRIFLGDNVRSAYNRLLADRESLVWRYVAVARGLCAGSIPELKQQIQESLREGLSPTEWRRAAASLAAFGAVKPDDALKITTAVVKRGLFTREDPASAAAFVWGIPRTIEAEPEAATKMLDMVLHDRVARGRGVRRELRYEYGTSRVVDRAMRQAYELLKITSKPPQARMTAPTRSTPRSRAT